MLTPKQSLYVRGDAGDPLPQVWDSLGGTRFRRGQLALVCAGPGVGKSGFALTYAVKSRLPTLYFSADSDAFTQLSRMVSIETGWSMDKSARLVRDEELDDVDLNAPIRFIYKAAPTLKLIEQAMNAYRELTDDEYPDLAVIDNITNVRAGGLNDEDPFQGLEVLMEFLHTLARDTESCVLGLHHVNSEYNDATKPIPMSGVKGQIGRVPELILTLHRLPGNFGSSDTLCVSTVKNRAGKADPSGRTFAELEFIGDSMTIRDFA